MTVMPEIKGFESDLKVIFEDLHAHPEIGFEETRTAAIVAEKLKEYGVDEVHSGIGGTGVVGLIRGRQTGNRCIGLRADMDALPIEEVTALPYASTNPGTMHACGHDGHTTMLLGAARYLAATRDFGGTAMVIFQPAEEGAPKGEEGGAQLMVKEGVLKNPDVDAIFGLHINSGTPVGRINYRKGGIMAASQSFKIDIKGKQSHGSRPWTGIDPIMISAKIIDGLQTIVSREAELTKEAAVITVGKIDAGVRSNIIPESASMIGTIRTLDYDMQAHINKRMKEMVPAIAKAYKAEATIEIERGYPITFNNHKLVDQMLPTLQRVAGKDNVKNINAVTGAEDFSFFAKEIPGFYFFLGGMTPGDKNPFPHHTPDFQIDESGMLLGVKVMTNIVFDYLNQ